MESGTNLEYFYRQAIWWQILHRKPLRLSESEYLPFPLEASKIPAGNRCFQCCYSSVERGWSARQWRGCSLGRHFGYKNKYPTNEPSVRKRNKIPGTLAHIVPSRVTLMEKTFGSRLPSKGMVLICWVDLSKVYNPFVVPNHIFFSWSSAMYVI